MFASKHITKQPILKKIYKTCLNQLKKNYFDTRIYDPIIHSVI